MATRATLDDVMGEVKSVLGRESELENKNCVVDSSFHLDGWKGR